MTTTAPGSSKQAPRPLDEDTIEAVRRRIGIPVVYSPREHNEVSSTDSFRHFARGYGDDNPLYCDPEYARASSWGSSIAPPIYPYSAGVHRPANWTAEQKAEMSGGNPLAGIGEYMCGERWLFLKPVRAGDVLMRTHCLHAAELKTSSFGGGVGALVSHRTTWDDDAGVPYAYRYSDFWHAERERSGKTGKYRDLQLASYDDEALDQIDALYEAETVRGANARRIDDVRVGEELGPIAKGPLSLTDVICWHIGVGWGNYGGGASKVAYKNRQRVRKLYTKNQYGFFDSVQRCHWDPAWAQELGHPTAYDYGLLRSNWLVHLVTNWMGDDAWLWKLTSSVRRFNYQGDSHVVSGVVQSVDVDASTVTIDAQGVNQRGETTFSGTAVVILPRADEARAALPEYHPGDEPEATGP
jgi:acyl dehydratase